MPTSQPSELTSQDLRAPVSAMHNMSQNDESRHHSSRASTDTTYCTNQPRAVPQGILFERNVKQEDMVSKGIIGHQQARQLFTSFIANATNFLPIFDPILDSFEALRLREPFCFGVILTLACCIDGLLQLEQCVAEIKALLAGTLFDCRATTGTVQGMMLLVIYAENTCFAIGHALQMAQDPKLDRILSDQQVLSQPWVSEHIEQQRRTMRNARVWLALCLIEREVAIGTARSCRIPKVSAADLTYLTHQSLAHPPNMRFASLVEAVQVRDEFLSEITSAGDLQDTGLRRLHHIESKFEEWLQNWDAHNRGIFALEMSRHRDDLNAPEVLTTVTGIADILAGYHDPFFYQLIQARLSHHPSASSYMIPEQSSQNQADVCHNSKTRPAQCETASAAACSTQFQLPHSSVRQSLLPDMDFTGQSPLSQLLETPDWMLNPSSMLVFDVNNWQNNDTSDPNY
ncbi:unnamed protein product [Clonostachys rhizophaga]|uniref:Transcription factor domain-containing protein n=1 Tax=Clonostachys rhizophaga TaxID=160324 RepID=A0A9N9YNH6_9HYPO|nr:unnamed protein product [Clonostachys rhizophaga]